MDAIDGCGFKYFRPKCFQQFANTKWFMMVYGLLGTVQATGFLYLVVTLTTLEKRFKIPSQTTGIILSGNEISQILLALILSYAGGQRNRPKWIAWGVVFSSLSCFILAAPHFIYGGGEESLQLTQEYLAKYHINATVSTIESSLNMKSRKLCLTSAGSVDECDEVFSYLPLILIFMSQFVLGIGNTLYYALGQSYLDDHTRQQNSPVVLAYALALRMLGPVFGFLLGFCALNVYIEPSFTPIITKKDPRWLGAWWLGWILLGILLFIFSIFIGMFPKQLPKRKKSVVDASACERKEFIATHKKDLEPVTSHQPNMKDFPSALMRLLKNKLLMYNLFSGVFYILGSNGHMTYLTKYIEVLFNRNSSDATIFTGPITILGMAFGFVLSGHVISKFKPSPRKLFAWNVLVGLTYVLGQFTYMHLSCDSTNSLTINNTWTIPTECNAHCHCENVAYSPVCHVATRQTYFSACHAGCQTYNETNKTYSHCTCSSSRSMANYKLSRQSTTTEKVLIFHPINQTEEFSTAQNDVIDTTRFAELEEISSVEEIEDADYNVEYDDSQEKSFDSQTESILLREKRSATDMNEDLVMPGVCTGNCASAYLIFSVISLIINLFGSTGRIGNILMNFRAVDPKDKAFSQGLALTMVSLLALIPGPIIFGWIIDSTCKIWNEKCGEIGNCQLYDQDQFRYYVNFTAMCLTSVGVFFDVLVCYYSKNLDLYGDRVESNETDCEKNNSTKEKNSI